MVSWGHSSYGGNSSAVSSELSSGVVDIQSTQSAYAALKNNGSVVTWGERHAGGDSRAVQTDLSSDIQNVFSTSGAFAALKGDGSVVTWGHDERGGDSSWCASKTDEGVAARDAGGHSSATKWTRVCSEA